MVEMSTNSLMTNGNKTKKVDKRTLGNSGGRTRAAAQKKKKKKKAKVVNYPMWSIRAAAAEN